MKPISGAGERFKTASLSHNFIENRTWGTAYYLHHNQFQCYLALEYDWDMKFKDLPKDWVLAIQLTTFRMFTAM